jgi:hypothetical protein
MLGFQIMIEKETEFLIEASFDQKQTWHELKRKAVKIGPLTPLPMPTVSGAPPSNG